MKLWLIRHAKSDWNSGAASDFDRPLNKRGERDGPFMSEWLAERDHPASWIWTSDARRALATARFVAAGFRAADPELVEEHSLYNAAPQTLLDVIRSTPPDVVSAAVIAHNPGMTEAVNLLAGEVVTDNLPTFGIARFEVPEPWAELAFGLGILDFVTSPKRIDR